MNQVCMALTAGVAVAAMGEMALAQATFTQITTGLSAPVYAAAAPGDFTRLFIVEKVSGTSGRIRVLRTATNTLVGTPALSVLNVSTGNEQGLLGLAFHPNYVTNRLFYVNFTNASGNTVIREYRMRADNPEAADSTYTPRDLLTVAQPQDNHNGGWISFGPDGMLYIGMGDGGNGNDTGTGHTAGMGNAQDLTSNLLGKMLRIDVNRDDFPGDSTKNYGIPAGNPFNGVNGDREIWSYGLRNPWRNSFDRVTGELWIADVGQEVWEEINREPRNTPGRNYGWRCMEGLACTGLSGCTCNAAALTLPVHTYQHASSRCSVTGGYVYRGCAIPDLYGQYVFADYCTGEVWRLNPTNNQVTLMFDFTSLLTSFGEDAYGEMVFTAGNGRVYRLTRSGGTAPADCNGNGRPDCWDIADGTSQDRNSNGVPDSCDPVCPADFNGDFFLDGFDYDDFVACFELGTCPPGKTADFNNDGFADGFDYDDYVAAFENGCP